MDFKLLPHEEILLQEIGAFINNESSQALIDELRAIGPIYGGPEARKFFKKFADRGWLTPSWPKEYGGLNSSELLTYFIRDELAYHGIHLAFVGAHMAGPTILKVGSEELKREFLSQIAKGEIEFCLGYTEPDAGSDLSSLNMQAEEKEDFYIINGQKTFNTHAQVADYHWLAVRTSSEGPRHKGISMFIVDLRSPGITISPMETMAGWSTNEVFYDQVKVPKKNLVGKINNGFDYLMEALDFERMFPPNFYRKLFNEIVDYAKETVVNGKRLSENPLLRQKIAQIATEIEVSRMLYYYIPHLLEKGIRPSYQTSIEKIFTTELAQRIMQLGMEVLGPYGPLKENSKWAPLSGKVEHYYRWSVVETIYAGTTEIQKNVVAARGLKLPRA